MIKTINITDLICIHCHTKAKNSRIKYKEMKYSLLNEKKLQLNTRSKYFKKRRVG